MIFGLMMVCGGGTASIFTGVIFFFDFGTSFIALTSSFAVVGTLFAGAATGSCCGAALGFLSLSGSAFCGGTVSAKQLSNAGTYCFVMKR